MTSCNKPLCENNSFVICDTNFIQFLMDYIYKKNNRVEKNFLTQFGQFLSWICDCSTNCKINVSELLYDNELDVENNPDCSLIKNSEFLTNHNTEYNCTHIGGLFDKYIKKHPIDPHDLNSIIPIALKNYPNNPPSPEDVSLLPLGLRNSDKTNISLLISEDMTLLSLLTNYIAKNQVFEINRNDFVFTRNLIPKGFISFLSPIYSDCKFSKLLDIIDFYESYISDLLDRIKRPYILRGKVRVSISFASDVVEHIRMKHIRRGMKIRV